MSIKMTVREAIGAYQAIERLPASPNGKANYDLGYISQKLEQGINVFERLRDRLTRELSVEVEETDEKTGTSRKVKRIPPEKMDDFTGQLEKALDAEITVERSPIVLAEYEGSDPKRKPNVEPSLWRPLVDKVFVEKARSSGPKPPKKDAGSGAE
jgi:hypothetical protein